MSDHLDRIQNDRISIEALDGYMCTGLFEYLYATSARRETAAFWKDRVLIYAIESTILLSFFLPFSKLLFVIRVIIRCKLSISIPIAIYPFRESSPVVLYISTGYIGYWFLLLQIIALLGHFPRLLFVIFFSSFIFHLVSELQLVILLCYVLGRRQVLCFVITNFLHLDVTVHQDLKYFKFSTTSKFLTEIMNLWKKKSNFQDSSSTSNKIAEFVKKGIILIRKCNGWYFNQIRF